MLSSFVAIAMLQASSVQVPAPAPQPAVTISPCRSDPAYAAFDFWVGEWDVYSAGSEAKLADSRIERPGTGCGVIETWMPLQGPGGNSISNFEPSQGIWHQKWIGASPGMVEFRGGPVGSGMVLTGYWPGVGGPGTLGLVKMTYSLQPDKSVRQYGEVSYDHGATWEVSFDLTYRRKGKDKK